MNINKPIEKIHIYFGAEPMAGLNAASFEASVFIDLACFDELDHKEVLESIRAQFMKVYEEMMGNKPTWVKYDFELDLT